MNHPSNNDLEKLQAVIMALDKIIFKYDPTCGMHTNLATTLAKIKYDVDSLQSFAISQSSFIYSRTSSSYLKGVVNSVFDSMSVDETLAELKGFKL